MCARSSVVCQNVAWWKNNGVSVRQLQIRAAVIEHEVKSAPSVKSHHAFMWIKHGLHCVELCSVQLSLHTSSALDFTKGVAAYMYVHRQTHTHTHTHTHIHAVCCWQPLEGWVVMCYVRSSGGERWGFLTHRSRSGLSPPGFCNELGATDKKSVCVCAYVCVWRMEMEKRKKDGNQIYV